MSEKLCQSHIGTLKTDFEGLDILQGYGGYLSYTGFDRASVEVPPDCFRCQPNGLGDFFPLPCRQIGPVNFDHQWPESWRSLWATRGAHDMTDDTKLAKFRSQAAEVRQIARGIFDKAEHRTVLKFVADAVKLAADRLSAAKRQPT